MTYRSRQETNGPPWRYRAVPAERQQGRPCALLGMIAPDFHADFIAHCSRCRAGDGTCLTAKVVATAARRRLIPLH